MNSLASEDEIVRRYYTVDLVGAYSHGKLGQEGAEHLLLAIHY